MRVYMVVGVFILFDVATGIIKGLYNEGLNSALLRQGLFRKITEIITVIGSGLLERGVEYVNFDFDVPLLNYVSVYICGMELISILENIGSVNTSLQRLFSPYLEKLKNKGEK